VAIRNSLNIISHSGWISCLQ